MDVSCARDGDATQPPCLQATASAALAALHAPVVDVCRRLRGPYAFVFWHEAGHALYLSKDPFGRRSLLVQAQAGCLRATSVAPQQADVKVSSPAFAANGPKLTGSAPSAPYHELPPGLYVLAPARAHHAARSCACVADGCQGSDARNCGNAASREGDDHVDSVAITSAHTMCAFASAALSEHGSAAVEAGRIWQLSSLYVHQSDTSRCAALSQRRCLAGALHCTTSTCSCSALRQTATLVALCH